MTDELQQAGEALRAFALGFPEAYEEFPWGERVIKVNKKVFVFFGLLDDPAGKLSVGVKLPHTGVFALQMAFVTPTAYSLGKYGWVTARFAPGDSPPLDLLQEWIEESYRAVAPKRLVAQLDGPRPAG